MIDLEFLELKSEVVVQTKAQKLAVLKAKNSKKPVSEPKRRVLSMGWGVQSFTLAAMSALGELPKLDLIIHADTTWEREETTRFMEKYTPWLESYGLTIVSASSLSARSLERKSGKQIFVPAYFQGTKGDVKLSRLCTSRWKINVVRQLIRQELEILGLKPKPGIVEQWLGISRDEASRAKDSEVRYITVRHPFLEEATRMTRYDCIKWLTNHGIDIPVKSSCTHCCFHSQNVWESMKRENGPDWKQAIYFDSIVRKSSTKKGRELFVHRSMRSLEKAVPLPEEAGYTQSDLIDGPGCDSAGYCWD